MIPDALLGLGSLAREALGAMMLVARSPSWPPMAAISAVNAAPTRQPQPSIRPADSQRAGGGPGPEGAAAGAWGGSAGSRAVDKDIAPPICAACRKPLSGPDPRSSSEGPLECDGCHRCFHGSCHRRWAARRDAPASGSGGGGGSKKGGGTGGGARDAAGEDAGGPGGGDADGPWFHDATCRKVHFALQFLCRAGNIPCAGMGPPLAAAVAAAGAAASRGGGGGGGGKSAAIPSSSSYADGDDGGGALAVRFYSCRTTGPATAAGLRRVHSVLRQSGFGYSLRDVAAFDYAALLTHGPTAVSAALLDVYGTDLAELFLLGTAASEQRKGYGTALLRQLEGGLGGAGVQRLLVSVDDDDEDNQRLWRGKFGYRPLEADAGLAEAQASLAAFTPTAAAGTVFLCRRLL